METDIERIQGLLNIVEESIENPPKGFYVDLDMSRFDIPKLFWLMGFERGVEIGVCKGKFSHALIADNPLLKKLYAIDPYDTYQPVDADYLFKDNYDEALAKLTPFIDDGRCEFIKLPSFEVVKEASDNLNFVHIDGDHRFNSVLADITQWSEKIVSGGVIACMSFYISSNGMVKIKDAVKHYFSLHPEIETAFLTQRDSRRTIFWVKP